MSGLFKKPAAPKPVPLPDEAAIDATRRRAAQQAQAKSGRAATQLAPRQAQQGREYSRRTLG
jgi:hypothetical protein